VTRRFDNPGDNQLTIRSKAVYVGAVHESFIIPLELPFCDEFPIIPASFCNTYTARGVWNSIGDLFTIRIYCVDSSSPGFAARNLEDVARLMDLLKCVFVLSGWWRRYFRRAAGWILYRRSFFLNLTGIDAPCAGKVSKVLSVKYRGNKQTYCS